MDEPRDRDRRFVLGALACLVPTMACARTTTTASTTAPPLAVPSGPVPEAIAALGQRYLDAHPEDADREVLWRALGLDPSDPDAKKLARIDAALRRDLETDDVVDIDGWRLTRTECRLYALAALT